MQTYAGRLSDMTTAELKAEVIQLTKVVRLMEYAEYSEGETDADYEHALQSRWTAVRELQIRLRELA